MPRKGKGSKKEKKPRSTLIRRVGNPVRVPTKGDPKGRENRKGGDNQHSMTRKRDQMIRILPRPGVQGSNEKEPEGEQQFGKNVQGDRRRTKGKKQKKPIGVL